MAETEPSSELAFLIDVSRQAGDVAMSYFKSENKIWYKSGNSPVSEADHEVDALLRNAFAKERPDYGWLSEETDDDLGRLGSEKLVIVDPIDGTRGFLDGNPRWCISMAIVENQRPTTAVLFCPALNQLYAAERGSGLITENIDIARIGKSNRPLVTGSKRLIETLKGLPDRPFDVEEFVPSLAYRLAMVASGMLDAAFAWPGASEWDIAAADLLLEESGCVLSTRSGESIRYNQKNVKVPALVAARNDNQSEILALAESSGILH